MSKPSVELICKLLRIGKATYYRYKKDNAPILKLIGYYTNEEIKELLDNGILLSREEDLNKSIKSYIDEQIDKKLKEKNL